MATNEKLPHSSTRRGFSTHNSVGTDNLANPNVTGGVQPGMIEMTDVNGGRWYLHVSTAGDLRISATVNTITTADTSGDVVVTQT